MKTLFLILFFTSTIFSQMVPHPELLRKINNGEIEIPYTLKNRVELRERGLGAGWTSEELAKENSLLNKKDVNRIFGPAKVQSGVFKSIFLFVEFSDKAEQVSVSFFDDLIFSTNSTSMRGYYSEISYGNLDLTTDDLPSTIGWVTAPQSYAYYVDGQNGSGTYPKNAQGLVRDVVALVDPLIDFSPYDNDGDGYIDALFIVHTGPGAEFTGSDDDIWSHAWSIPGGYTTNDGVIAFQYGIQPEYWLNPGDMTIGVYAHEMAHAVFGLPDVYDLDYTSYGTGNWSLMSGGSWNGVTDTGGDMPAWPDAWNHIQMGYATPTVVTTGLQGEIITATSTQADIYKLWKDGTQGSEYFLVQNRQQVGYDAALPGNGILIWHVDETQTSNDNEWYPGNTNSGHYQLALEQADGNYDLEKNTNPGDAGDPYPGNTTKSLFNTNSQPNSNSYGGAQTFVTVKNISPSGITMTADFDVSQTTASLQLTSPNGGEMWQGNSVQKIEWINSLINSIKIELSTNGGSSWSTIAESVNANLGKFNWTVPNTPSNNCYVKITDVSNSTNVDQSSSSFTISSAPEIVVVNPNGGETYSIADSTAIVWASTGVSNVKLEYSTNNGTNWNIIATSIPSSGLYEWVTPATPSNECLVKISDVSDPSVYDESDDVFAITAAPELLVISPNGGEIWESNSVQLIKWSGSGVNNVKLEYTTNGGTSWVIIAESVNAAAGQLNWTVPNTPSSNCFVKVTDVDDNTIADISNFAFTIVALPAVTITNPNGGENYIAGNTEEITWSSINVSNVKIEYSINAGIDWLLVESSLASTGSYNWNVPYTPSEECLLKITDNSDNSITDESDAVFTISQNQLGRPSLVFPVNNSVNIELPVSLEWSVVLGAVGYTVQLAEDTSFSNIFYEQTNVTSPFPVESLTEGMKYYWRVLAEGQVHDGSFSGIFSFVTKLSTPDILVAKVFMHTPKRVNLSWNDNSNGETGYLIERADADTNWMPHDLVGENEEYWWETVNVPTKYKYRVKAKSDFAESEYSNEASVIISDIEDYTVPQSYSLDQNYPNPFNPSTQIKFGLPFDSNVKLIIYNILGEVVAELVNKNMTSGYHSIEWNSSGLASGIYIYTLFAQSIDGDRSYTSVKKMLLLK